MDLASPTYRTRLLYHWPRLVVALVSLYGIFYATDVIQSTREQIYALGTTLHQHDVSHPSLSRADSVPMAFEPPQLMFNSNSRGSAAAENESKSTRGQGDDIIRPNSTNNSKHGHPYNGIDKYLNHRASPPIFGQIRLVTDADIDIDGHTEAAAIYTLLVIASLSIIDNAIGLMVATRRSLRLTQVAFVIWCLRFLFRILSLISVLFMLAVGAEFRKQTLHLDVEFEGSGSGNDSTSAYTAPTMITVTALEIIIAAVHGWSLLVLIRDLRNQPRPRTFIARAWLWFCSSRWGSRLGLVGGVEGDISSGRAAYVGFSDMESSHTSSGVWDRETAASLGLGSGLTSSASSIRSAAVSIPEMTVGRSRASSISSFSSTEKV